MKHVIIEWNDVRKTMNDDIFNNDDDIDGMYSFMRTIGWLYKGTDKTVLLVQEFCDHEPRDWIVIPKCLIIKTMVI
jgi:hypothetical protein